MKIKIVFCIALLVSLISFFIKIVGIAEKDDFKFSVPAGSIAVKENISHKTSFNKLLKGQKIDHEFTAKQNNLGSIEFLFNNYAKINKDKLIFRIKELGSGKWYYQNTYDTSLMDIGQFFPFGFPVIPNSSGHQYLVELESVNGNNDDSVSISNRNKFILVDYAYGVSYLKSNFIEIPHFLFSKALMYIGFLGYSDMLELSWFFLIPFIFTALLLEFLILLKKYYKPWKISKPKWTVKDLVLKNRYVLLLLVIYFVTHLRFLKYTQYWDAQWYWELLLGGVDNFKKLGFVNAFNFLGHPSMAYVSLMSIPQFIDRGNVFLLNFENMLLAMIAIWAFYKIVEYFFKGNVVENILLTAIFAFNPLFNATSISFNLDFPVLVFEILMFASIIYEKYFLFTVCSIFLVFSKETGVLVYTSFASFYVIFISIKRWTKGDSKINLSKIIVFLLPIFSFIVYLYLNKWNIWNSRALENTGNSFTFIWNDNGNFNFGLNSVNIFTRTFEIFVMNFSWVMTLIIFISLVKSMIFYEGIAEFLPGNKRDWFRVMIAVFVTFVFFNFVYIVMPFSRYVVEGIFFLIIAFYVSLSYLLGKHLSIMRLVLIVVLILSFVQTFKAIDPSPQIIFGTRYWGKNISSPFFGYADGIVYNTQFVFMDELTQMINKSSDGKVNLIRDNSDEYFFRNINYIGKVDDLEKLRNKGVKNLRYVYIPWFADKDGSLNKINKYYKLTYFKTVEYDGYFAVLYDLTPN